MGKAKLRSVHGIGAAARTGLCCLLALMRTRILVVGHEFLLYSVSHRDTDVAELSERKYLEKRMGEFNWQRAERAR
jgi:hypothetical protein